MMRRAMKESLMVSMNIICQISGWYLIIKCSYLLLPPDKIPFSLVFNWPLKLKGCGRVILVIARKVFI